MPAQFNAVTQTSGTASQFTLQHTAAGSHRAVVVAVSLYSAEGYSLFPTVNGITYAGQAMAKLAERSEESPHRRIELWGMANPPTGQQNVVVNLSTTARCIIGVTSYTGVDQDNPWRNTVVNSGTNSTGSVSIASHADDIVLGALAVVTPDISYGSTGTARWHNAVLVSSDYYNFHYLHGTGSTASGAANINFQWFFLAYDEYDSYPNTQPFAAAAVSIRGLQPVKRYITNIGGYEAPEEYGTISVAHTHGDWVWGAWEEVEYVSWSPGYDEGLIAHSIGSTTIGGSSIGGAVSYESKPVGYVAGLVGQSIGAMSIGGTALAAPEAQTNIGERIATSYARPVRAYAYVGAATVRDVVGTARTEPVAASSLRKGEGARLPRTHSDKVIAIGSRSAEAGRAGKGYSRGIAGYVWIGEIIIPGYRLRVKTLPGVLILKTVTLPDPLKLKGRW